MQTMKTREMLLLIIFYYSALFFLIKGSGENEVLTEKNTNRALFFYGLHGKCTSRILVPINIYLESTMVHMKQSPSHGVKQQVSTACVLV